MLLKKFEIFRVHGDIIRVYKRDILDGSGHICSGCQYTNRFISSCNYLGICPVNCNYELRNALCEGKKIHYYYHPQLYPYNYFPQLYPNRDSKIYIYPV